MNEKINDVLNDVIHTASQAIIAEDEAIKLQALGDIVHAVSTLVPRDERMSALQDAETKALRIGMLTDARREETKCTGVEG